MGNMQDNMGGPVADMDGSMINLCNMTKEQIFAVVLLSVDKMVLDKDKLVSKTDMYDFEKKLWAKGNV